MYHQALTGSGVNSFMISVFDGHNDTLLKLYTGARGENASFMARSDEGQLDFVRAQEGGLVGGFFALYSPSLDPGPDVEPEETENGYRVNLAAPRDRQAALADVIAMAAILFRTERESAGQFTVVRTVADLQQALATGVMAAIFHIEGAEAIDTDLATLELLYQAGLRSLGPVWSRQNVFGSGVPFSFPSTPDTGDGLSWAGKELVQHCNELGIMLDLSHMTERGFWDVARLSDAPLVATHSNVHALSASPRNLTDKQLDAIRDSDGMVGLNYAVSFLREDGRPDTQTGLDVMVRHVDYLLDKLGEDRVGFGSDFDGARIPDEISDASKLQNLLVALRQHGYNDTLLNKLGTGNWLRVLGLTWHD